MGVSLRERRRQMLRNEILTAARDLIAEKGYLAMSMDELAARVGVSKPTLYSHFSTKDEIIIAVAMLPVERLVAVLKDNPTDHTPLEQLGYLLHTSVQIHLADGPIAPQLWTPEFFELLHAHPVSSKLLHQLDEAVVQLTQAGIAQGEIDPSLDPATLVRVLYSMIHAVHLAPHSCSGVPNPDLIADTVTAIFRRGVQAQPPEMNSDPNNTETHRIPPADL